MFLVWQASISGPTAFKCNEIPTNGSGQQRPHIASRVLTAAEAALSIAVLERLYPAPKESTDA